MEGEKSFFLPVPAACDGLRADEAHPSLSQEEALRGAPEAVDGFFALPEQEGGEEDD